ncbi:MAG: hypothetical protein KGR98_14740 [Verrucomicrobia bacterium]|nr:hypothetical protein [Verrucomicrobiota bacterium]MDE3098736.1 hypothetical protein [Verrucomicrobiota bacterium]
MSAAITASVAELEAQLDSFDSALRNEALARLWDLVQTGQIQLPAPGTDVNLHSHTFFSYNAYGYSPSKFAWLARKRGLAAAGIVDFDVLDGLEEFWDAGKRVGLKRCASLESRAYFPQFASRVINSPGEPGIAYNMGVGFPRAVHHPLLAQMRRTADSRNRELVRRVNRFLQPVVLDYDKDVLSLTPNGNATERHICEAYSKKGNANFWKQKIGDRPADPAKFQALIRAKTMKKGGPGYVQPDKGSFPLLSEMNRFILDSGAIPTLTWFDGATDGERAGDELFEAHIAAGAAALAIIPDRNFTAGVKDQKLDNLHAVIARAQKHGFPIVVGTEMNAPGNKFVDSFDAPELKPFVPLFLAGARVIYAHAACQRACGLGYLSEWAKRNFKSVAAKNEFFEQLGRQLQPLAEDRLAALRPDASPPGVLSAASAAAPA